MPIEIVDLAIRNGDVPSFFVCLPGRVGSPYDGELSFLSIHPYKVRLQWKRLIYKATKLVPTAMN